MQSLLAVSVLSPLGSQDPLTSVSKADSSDGSTTSDNTNTTEPRKPRPFGGDRYAIHSSALLLLPPLLRGATRRVN